MFTYDKESFDRLIRVLKQLSPTMRRGMLRKALRAGAKLVQRTAATPGIVPILQKPVYKRGKLVRRPGTLQRNIIVRRSKDAEQDGDVGVFVNVKPARGALRGADSPDDPFYWRFVHFGTKKMAARPFLTIGARELQGPALRAIEASLKPDLEQLDLPGVNR